MGRHWRWWLGLVWVLAVQGHETIWLEAENLRGLQGYYWPLGRPELRQNPGHWGLSGPGWAAEWNQGGESGFLSIAAGPAETQATATAQLTIPVAGSYFVWVRYADWREADEPITVRLEQPGRAPWAATWGTAPVTGEDQTAKLYYGWAFGWDVQPAELAAGPATLTLLADRAGQAARQVDVLVLTTDPAYRPGLKERPANPTWALLEQYRHAPPRDLAPLARRATPPPVPEAWRPRSFGDHGFLYLWNMDAEPQQTWLSDRPDRVPVPYRNADPAVRTEIDQTYAGLTDVPIFGDPRLVPTFTGSGPALFRTKDDGPLTEAAQRFAAWLDAHPDRLWATLMNYQPDTPTGPVGLAAFQRYRSRYVGAVSGENLGYFYPKAEEMRAATAQAQTRRQLVEAFTPLTLAGNAAKYRAIYGRDLDANPYQDVISCLSVGNITFAPLLSQWGVRTLGYESAVATSSILGMRWAFLRGLARQGGHLTATYRSCNFGDSATMFAETAGYYPYPKHILDNYYTVYAGAGATWYKFDIWYQYMAGASMFYHEQGFDEYWKPGGTSAAGLKPLELSPKGKLVDRFLRLTRANFDRGTPYTPVAFLVDYAHGWEPSAYWPNAFKNWHQQPDRFLRGPHEQMLQEWLWCAYHPIGPESEKPLTALNEVYLPAVFGDLYDVIAAYPDTARWTTIDTYPVVIAIGEIELTDAEGRRLAEYVQRGGTLLVADAHLTGPGLAHLRLPAAGAATEADHYLWLDEAAPAPSPRFQVRPLTPGTGDRVLARTVGGEVICLASDRGEGRLIVLSIPHGLSLTGQAVPLVPRLLAHLTRGLLPITVEGDVEWLLNRNQAGWMVTLLNPFGDLKPQQGIFPTDYRENRAVTIRCQVPIAQAVDKLRPSDPLKVQEGAVRLTVPAGDVRIIELTP